MARSRDLSNQIADIERFLKLCDLVESHPDLSVQGMAKRLNISTPGLSLTIDRLETDFGMTLLDTRQGVRGVSVTDSGKRLRARMLDIIHDVEILGSQIAGKEDEGRYDIRVGASPLLLAHAMPLAARSYLNMSTNEQESRHIRCFESYNIEDIILDLENDKYHFATIWEYPGRLEKIIQRPGLTCIRASRRFDAVVVFGKNHAFRKRLNSEGAGVRLSDLDKQILYVLKREHQFFEDHIPIPDRRNGGDRIEWTTIASMIGSIRAGMNGVAIVAGLHHLLDRFRRDGSLYSLPLHNSDGSKLFIDVIYAIRNAKPSLQRTATLKTTGIFNKIEAEIPELTGLERNSKILSFIKHIDSTLMGLPKTSGWMTDAVLDKGTAPSYSSSRWIQKAYDDLPDYRYVYHLTTPIVGVEEPRWVESKIAFDVPDNSARGRRHEFEGHLERGGDAHSDENRKWKVKARLVGNHVICIRGRLLNIWGEETDNDSFVACPNIVTPEDKCLVGVWSGRDDSDTGAISALFVISKGRLSSQQLSERAYPAMIRNLAGVTSFGLTETNNHG